MVGSLGCLSLYEPVRGPGYRPSICSSMSVPTIPTASENISVAETAQLIGPGYRPSRSVPTIPTTMAVFRGAETVAGWGRRVR